LNYAGFRFHHHLSVGAAHPGSFAVNGFVVTWALPEFTHPIWRCFRSFNGSFVAVFGLVLTGAAALIAHYVPEAAIEPKKYRRK